ncbi:MAG: hypothetical protein IAC13_07750 [Firmicutes bacterium]|uniref:Anti-sigma-28 factor FlgM C-terminal domain-containing protein n=1 Tax=Candidatus Scybalomonas excrementavium TaxID=2840943 RepID=A0A9D9I0W4_9FIRM|nr:hypothetical protein [Candidatus Scybalomonas excrementavium]
MKITSPCILSYKEQEIPIKRSNRTVLSEQKNFDSFIIQSNQSQMEEQSFLYHIKNSLSKEIQNTTKEDSNFLLQLQQQIKNGTYQPNSIAIATKILLCQQEESHV